eukprot:15331488-Ditylum_brightwellii.AAC.2
MPFLQSDRVSIWGSIILVSVVETLSKSLPTQSSSCTIQLVDGATKQVSNFNMASITRTLDPPPTLQPSQLVLPDWIGNTKKISMVVDG